MIIINDNKWPYKQYTDWKQWEQSWSHSLKEWLDDNKKEPKGKLVEVIIVVETIVGRFVGRGILKNVRKMPS